MNEKELQTNINELTMLFSVMVKRGVSQSVLIKELNEVGFEPKRIAEIVGTTPNTVRVAIHHLKKGKNEKK